MHARQRVARHPAIPSTCVLLPAWASVPARPQPKDKSKDGEAAASDEEEEAEEGSEAEGALGPARVGWGGSGGGMAVCESSGD